MGRGGFSSLVGSAGSTMRRITGLDIGSPLVVISMVFDFSSRATRVQRDESARSPTFTL